MAEVEILRGKVPYLMLETAPLAGPAAHVCAKETPRNPASEEFLMITQSVSHRKTRPAHYSDSER